VRTPNELPRRAHRARHPRQDQHSPGHRWCIRPLLSVGRWGGAACASAGRGGHGEQSFTAVGPQGGDELARSSPTHWQHRG